MALVKQRQWRLSLIRQRDISDCGAACLVSVCAYYGLHIAVARMRQMVRTNQNGTSVLAIVEAAMELGLHAKGLRAAYESLEHTTHPSIIHVIIDQKVSHFMVLMKVSTRGVLVMDPSEGRLKSISQEKFKKIWSGIIVLIQPGEKFRPNVKPSHSNRVKALINPFKRSLIKATVFAAIASVLGLITSVYVKEVIDVILVRNQKNLLDIISAIAIILLSIQFLVTIIKNKLVLKTGRLINCSLIMEYYKHVLSLPQSFFNNLRVGEMLSRINDAAKITAFIHDAAVNLIVNILIVLFSLALMFYYNWKIALVIFLIVPVYGLLYYFSNRVNNRCQRELAVSGAELESSLVESFGAAATIRQLSLEKYFTGKTAGKLHNLLNNVFDTSLKQVYIQLSAEFVCRLFTILLMWLGSYYVISNKLTAGELISFYTLLTWFSIPLMYVFGANKSFIEARIAAERLFEIMDLQPEVNGWKKIHTGKVHRIEFINVQFSYGNEPVLKCINLSILNGTITGIRGKSGSGKSTLVSLLVKSYKPSFGKITINDIDINEIDSENLTGMISMVMQKTDLFSATIAENITLGCMPDENKLADICERLGITRFTSCFPHGLNTIITEQGNNLSGGQKQRISIARALFRNTPVLLLDEATAATDAESEEKIMQTIEWYKNIGNTVIIVAHNDSTLKICDNIVVLEDGVIK